MATSGEITPLLNRCLTCQDLVAVFKAAPEFDAEYVKTARMLPSLSIPVVQAVGQSLSLPLDSPGQGAQRRSRSSRGNGSNSSSSNSSNNCSAKHLTPTQIALMQSLYQVNTRQFEGAEWVLPSGAIVDLVLFEITKDMRFEYSLHSFVIETHGALLGLFPDPMDQDELWKVLIERAGEGLLTLSSAEVTFIEHFNKNLADLGKLSFQ